MPISCLSHNLFIYYTFVLLAGTKAPMWNKPEGDELDPAVHNRRRFKKNSTVLSKKALTVTAKTGEFTANGTGKDQLFCIETEEIWQKRNFWERFRLQGGVFNGLCRNFVMVVPIGVLIPIQTFFRYSAGARAFKVERPNLKVGGQSFFIDINPEKACRA